MKTKIYTKWSIAFIAFLMISMNAFSQAPPITSVGTGVNTAGTFTVPINVTGFTNVGNISLKLNYDSAILVFTGATLNAGLIPANTVVTPVTDQSGSFRLSYTSSSAVVLSAPTDRLLTLTFTVKSGVTATHAQLAWSTFQGDCDMAPPVPGVFTPQITSANLSTYFIGNYIDIVPPLPTITGPAGPNMQEYVAGGVTTGVTYFTEAGMTNYQWAVSAAGSITAGATTNSITVTWTNPTGNQTVSVNYTDPLDGLSAAVPTVCYVVYYPFPAEIVPTTIQQFVDPLPHFAAGLRVNAKTGGNLIIKAVPVQQVALSTGTVTTTGTIGDIASPNAGKGTYAAYAISKDNGATFGPAMWPAQTIETQQGNGVTVQYRNDLFGLTYDNFNILADQTLLLNGYPVNGNRLTDPYKGPIPMVTHLHGGEMPSNSDGGPTAWFMPGYSLLGPGFLYNASSLATYPNQQESGTLWYHPHDQGLTRINVYTGLAGFYFLRGQAEETAHLPGWSGDDKVREVTPAGKTATFNGTNTYLPEIEVAIQDRMFNVKGELYWPVTPTNPDIHPYWTPEFFGDVFTVNGKTWPYLSVAPRKYRFRMLDGCNARFLNMWLKNLANGNPGPAITVIGSDANFMDSPAVLDPAAGKTLFMAPGERYDVVIDFSGVPAGTVFTLMNDAAAPYPTGDPVVPGLTDMIMQFVVNGEMVAASGGGPGVDNSSVPGNLRTSNPMVKLTDFAGNLTAGVTPNVKRHIILNEVTGAGGPVQVLFNNSHFDGNSPIPGAPPDFGGPTELPLEGTTELISVINTTVDAHPIHIHLLQWQLVKRQAFDAVGYMNAYSAAWAARGIPEWPAGLGYPGGAGSPYRYDSINADGAIGGNPALTPFLTGPVIPASPEEQVWKDDIKSIPGTVSTYIVRVAPTDRPIGATQAQLLFPFDPSLGPGYVWHCHIIDHEDMDMMRPLMIQPSALRYPQITTQPANVVACDGDAVTYNVVASSASPITYQWQMSVDAGATWTNLVDGAPYSGVLTASLQVNPAVVLLSGRQYRCVLTNIDGVTNSNAATLAVSTCTISGSVKYNNALLDPLTGFTVTANGKSATTDALGAFTITGVTSGVQNITVNPNGKAVGAINSTDAGTVNYWFANPVQIAHAKYLSGDVNNDLSITAADGLSIQRYFVLDQPFGKAPWVFGNATGTGNSNPPALTLPVNGVSVSGFNILAQCTGDFNGSFNPNAPKGAKTNVEIITGDVKTVTANQDFELPLRAVSKMQIGAVSLVLNFPGDLVEVKGAYLKGSKSPVAYNVRGNELRIGWNSTSPVSVVADGDVIVLKLRSTSSFTEGKAFEIAADFNPLNEIADANLEMIKGAALKSETILAIAPNDNLGTDIALSNYPNPVSSVVTFIYSIPADGSVTLDLHNSLGENLSTLVKEYKVAGRYTFKYDASSMSEGIYMITLKLRAADKDLVRTIKFIVNK